MSLSDSTGSSLAKRHLDGIIQHLAINLQTKEAPWTICKRKLEPHDACKPFKKKTIVGCGIEIPGLTCQCMNCLYFPSPKGLKKARLLLAAKKHGITAKHPCPTLHDHEGMGICKVHVFHFRTIKVTQAQAMLWRSSHLRSQSADCQTFNPSLVWVAHHPKCGAYYPFLRLSKNTCKLLCKPLSPSVGAYLRVFSVRPPALAG